MLWIDRVDQRQPHRLASPLIILQQNRLPNIRSFFRIGHLHAKLRPVKKTFHQLKCNDPVAGLLEKAFQEEFPQSA